MPGPLSKVFSRQLTPEEALRNAPSGPLIDLLARFLAQTQAQPYGKQLRAGMPMPTTMPEGGMMGMMGGEMGKQMRETKGPVKAGTAKRIASEREAMMKKLMEE